jgi:hypothetical protein
MPGCKAVGKEFDHYPKPVAKGGLSTLENGRLLCKPCNARTGIQTAKEVTKADKQAGRIGQHARRSRAKAAGKHKQIQSAGFSKTLRRKMNGTTVRRET